ncbi:hypothetical protein FB451DRAFT_1284313 [Mycena latifolia]|nr:hypothetical protein FB451DRAFT_1284313 [Mycena latifolia]
MQLVAPLFCLSAMALAAVAAPTPPDAPRATTVTGTTPASAPTGISKRSSESGVSPPSSAISHGTDVFAPVDLVPANVDLGIQEGAKPKSHGPGGCMIA